LAFKIVQVDSIPRAVEDGQVTFLRLFQLLFSGFVFVVDNSILPAAFFACAN
jgi:hypothetical protein